MRCRLRITVATNSKARLAGAAELPAPLPPQNHKINLRAWFWRFAASLPVLNPVVLPFYLWREL
jgi:hypothetical protein